MHLSNAVTGAWFGSYFANTKSWDKLPPKLQELYRISIDQSHYYRQVWYWGGEADLRVNGKKMEITGLPADEWSGVVEDSKEFWAETAQRSVLAVPKSLMHSISMLTLWKKLVIHIDKQIIILWHIGAGVFSLFLSFFSISFVIKN